MIVAADPAQAPENFNGSVFSSEEEKADYLEKLMNDVYQAGAICPARQPFRQGEARANRVVKNSGCRALGGGKIEADRKQNQNLTGSALVSRRGWLHFH
jgi:hypothetical protein